MNNGFKIEENFVNSLNDKTISEVPVFLKDKLIDIFDCSERDILRCKKYSGHYKPDVYIMCKNIKTNISIKSGDNISVHQELFDRFVDFLSKIGISNRTIKIIKFYHYGDGTIDGSGHNLLGINNIQLKYRTYIQQANVELNKNQNFIKIVNRILFSGKYSKDYSVDYLYYGTEKMGFLISKTQLINHLLTQKSMYLNCLHVGPFIYQPMSRKNNKVKYCQFKWKSFLSDILKII